MFISEGLSSWKIFCWEFLKLEVNILFFKYVASSIFNLIIWYALWKRKSGNYVHCNNVVVLSEIFFWDKNCWCIFVQEWQILKSFSFSTLILGRPKSPRWLSTISSLQTYLALSNCTTFLRSVDKPLSVPLCNISVWEIASA